jgi:hypothetical protein
MGRKMMALVYMVVGVALCVAGIVSCAWRGAADVDDQASSSFAQHIGQNRRVVVLPFEGDEDDTLDALSGKQWRSLSPLELGRCFNADYLIYGKVLSSRRLFFIFYSQIAMSVEIRLVETRRGRTVWKTAAEKRIQSGDVPLHPLSLVSAAVHTGIDVSDERMQDLIERTCRELAQRVPSPAGDNNNCFRANIQVASFSSGYRAQEMASKLQGKGYETRVERVRINGVDWHRVLVGPFAQADAETARQQLAVDPAARPVLIYAR